jgi:hypothetical protein
VTDKERFHKTLKHASGQGKGTVKPVQIIGMHDSNSLAKMYAYNPNLPNR